MAIRPRCLPDRAHRLRGHPRLISFGRWARAASRPRRRACGAVGLRGRNGSRRGRHMTAVELLSNLRDRGVRLWVEGADLRFSAPKGALGSGATELLTHHKAELIELLRPTPAGHSPQGESNSKSQSFSLDEHVIQLSAVHDWRLEDQDPYVRFVAPYKGFLYQRMALNKKFVRGEGCYLYDEAGNRYADFIAQFGAVPFGHDPAAIWEALSLMRQQRQPNLVITSISAA